MSVLVVMCGAGAARTAAAACAANGDPCDDVLFCTVADTCNASLTCVGLPRACGDLRTCTDDSCNEATDTCDHTVQAGMCLIGNSCYASGTLLMGDGCHECNPELGVAVWSQVEPGTLCDDQLFCSEVDMCTGAGVCVPVLPRSCDDRLDCTTDSCDENADACMHTLAADACLIGGECFAALEAKPGEPCRRCDPSQSTTDWSMTPAGAVCGTYECAAGVLTPPGACSGAGSCVSAPTAACPGGLCADVTSCAGACTADADCPAAAFCDGGICRNDLLDGNACTHPGQCLSNFCQDSVCRTDGGGGCSASAPELTVLGFIVPLLISRRQRRRPR